jgi:glycosyltransferase involved in cell wall biosynthesis
MNTVISQALATGLPTVATHHSGFPEQVSEGVNGFLGKENDPESMADAVLRYMEHPENWGKMSDASRAHVLKNYDQEALIERQIAYYNQLLA